MKDKSTLLIPMANDMHCHFRQGTVMKSVVPLIVPGGCDRALVMPNTIPPITSCEAARAYRASLMEIEPRIDYMMTLYLCDDVKVEDIHNNASSSFVTGVKSYPRGVTTHSDWGVESYERYYPVFHEMESLGLVLHIHGEMPNVSPLTAEQSFLPQLKLLCEEFPKLRIVLEHVSTKEAVDCVKQFSNVAGTITAHHLELTVQDVMKAEFTSQVDATDFVEHPHNFCKPLPKQPADREAIRDVVISGHPRFFLGSDSAPHRKSAKESSKPAAGVFTQPLLLTYIADTMSRLNCLENLENFVCRNAASFFSFPQKSLVEGALCVKLVKEPSQVPLMYPVVEEANEELVPFKAGGTLGWTCTVCTYTPNCVV